MYLTPRQAGRTSFTSQTPIRARRSQQNTPKTTPCMTARTEEILEEGDNYVLKALNSPVPVQVQEAIRTNSKVAGVKLDGSGWAWLVAGTKLLVWRYSTNQLSTKCYHVTLPASGSGWKAELIVLTSGTSDSKVSLMGCSPEGCVCWWFDILQSTSLTLQTSVDVGEGCVLSISSLPGHDISECLVTTTLANLWVVSTPTSNQDFESGLSLRSLDMPQSIFSGLGLRVSSIFFGSQHTTVPEARRVLIHSNKQNETMAIVLTSNNFQRWRISSVTDELLSDVNVVSLLKDVILVNGWLDPTTDPTIWIIDMQICKGFLALLFAVSDGPTIEHGIAAFPVTSDPTPSSLKHLIRLDNTVPLTSVSLATDFSLHGSDMSSSILVLNRNVVLLTDITNDEYSVNKVNSIPSSNSILGVGQLSGQLLVFNLAHGVIGISHNRSTPAVASTNATRMSSSFSTRLSISMMNTPTATSKPILSNISEDDVVERSQILENAFSCYLEGDIARAASLCEELFSETSFYHGVDTLGDLAVIQLSRLILDDPPPQVDSTISEGPDVYERSRIIIYRLQQKIEAHDKYIQFLNGVGLLERVACVSHRKNIISTRLLLREHGELLQAGVIIRKHHDHIVDGVIDLVVRSWPSSHPPLSKNDNFYTNLSLIEDFFPALVQYQKESLRKSQDKVTLLLVASTLLDSVLRNVLLYRQSKVGVYSTHSSSAEDNVHCDNIPWTASDGSRGMRSSIVEELDMLFEIGVAEALENQVLWNNIFSLMDILYGGYREQLYSLRLSPEDKKFEVRRNFEAHRKKFLTLLLDHGKLSLASELAERYEDFRVLIILCQGTGDIAKLKEYMIRFSEQGFSDFLFKQYLNEGRLQELLSFSEDFPTELGAFLEPHPTLNWLHHLSTHDYDKAHMTLKLLADQETKYVGRKKTLLSLSKLSLLASGSSEDKTSQLHNLNSQLRHIEVQEELPAAAVRDAEIDSNLMPPMSPQEIIKLCVGDHNPHSDEKQFLLALEYLNFSSSTMDESSVENLRTFIWSQALHKDDWTTLSTDDPLAEMQNTFFFRVVDEAYHQGWNLHEVLPDLNSLLTCPSLVQTGLNQDHTFKYLMKAGYEQVSRVQGQKLT